MEVWQVELVKAAGLALIGFFSGYGAYWLKNRAKQRDAERRERERQAEYEEFKKKRKLVGRGEIERMERVDKLTAIMVKLREHQITPEEFHDFRDQLIMGRKRGKRSAAERQATAPKSELANLPYDFKARAEADREFNKFPDTAWTQAGSSGGTKHWHRLVYRIVSNRLSGKFPKDYHEWTATKVIAILEERGPNGHLVGYDRDGNKVEWIPSEEGDGNDDPFWPMVLLRNEDAIHAAAEEYFDKVWWNRHQVAMEKIAAGEEEPYDPKVLETAKAAIKRIEEKYGRENLGWDDFEWGMVNGKLSALRWVLGSEWDFLDT